MRSINFTKSAEKSLIKLAKSDRRITTAIKLKLVALLDNPQPIDSLKMVGNPQYLRIRSGKYCIIYRYDETTLYVVLVSKREAVYEEFSRLIKDLS